MDVSVSRYPTWNRWSYRFGHYTWPISQPKDRETNTIEKIHTMTLVFRLILQILHRAFQFGTSFFRFYLPKYFVNSPGKVSIYLTNPPKG